MRFFIARSGYRLLAILLPVLAVCPVETARAQAEAEKTQAETAKAQAEPTECDRLGAIFLDPALPAGMTGVRTTELRAAAAEVACREALRADPDNSRIKAQLARALAERPEGRDEARLLFEQAFGAGHAWSAFGLATLESRAGGWSGDLNARYWWEQAERREVPEARLRSALMQLKESYPPANAPELVATVRELAEQGHPEAMFEMGMFALRGRHMPMNHNIATQWLWRAAKTQHTEAMYQLALKLADGGTETMQNQATDLFDGAAEKGHLAAMLKAAERQAELKWGRKNTPRALELYRRAERLGSKEAMVGLARGYVAGWAGVKDLEQATELYLKAVGFDKVDSATGLHPKVLIDPQTEAGAPAPDSTSEIYRKAMAGDSLAMLKLARLFKRPSIVGRWFGPAVYWFRKAAAAGADAGEGMMFMGMMFTRGIGVKPNKELAEYWFERAAGAGFAGAAHTLRVLRGSDKEDAQPFNSGTALAGYKHSRKDCDQLNDAIWIDDVGKGQYCIRIYKSYIGGRSENAMVLMLGDTQVFDLKTGKVDLFKGHAHYSPAFLNRLAAYLSWQSGGPAFIVARPGSFGSTGLEIKIRHTKTEANIINSTLSRIKKAEAVKRFDLVGQSGGGQMAFVMVKRRNDLRCVTAAAGILSMAHVLRHQLGQEPRDDFAIVDDPVEGLSKLKPARDLRLIVVHSKNDRIVPFSSAVHYVETARQHGLPVELIEATARDVDDHDVLDPALEKAYDCIRAWKP